MGVFIRIAVALQHLLSLQGPLLGMEACKHALLLSRQWEQQWRRTCNKESLYVEVEG